MAHHVHQPGAADVAATIGIGHDVGSDGDTTIEGDSSGNSSVGLDDSWFVSSDDGSFSDPLNTFVLFGNDDPATARSPQAASAFDPECFDDHVGADDTTSNDELGLLYDLEVPPGATCSLLFFNKLDPNEEPVAPAPPAGGATPADAVDIANAVAEAPDLQATDGTSPLLADLSADQLGSIRNWDLGGGDGSCVAPATETPPAEGPAEGPVGGTPAFTG